MSNIGKYFFIHFPIIGYKILYAELNSGEKTKTFLIEGRTYTELITLSEYLAAISYAVINDINTSPKDTQTN